MASKNIHHSEISPELLDDLGFTDSVSVGLMMSNLNIEDVQLSESLAQYDKIKKLLSPKHVPAKIFNINDIPKTKSGKIVELTIKKIINNENVHNLNSLINPECLEEYKTIAKKLNFK